MNGIVYPTKSIAKYDSDANGQIDYAENADKLDGKDASEFADVNHTHDDRYYTETEVDDKLATKSDVDILIILQVMLLLMVIKIGMIRV